MRESYYKMGPGHWVAASLDCSVPCGESATLDPDAETLVPWLNKLNLLPGTTVTIDCPDRIIFSEALRWEQANGKRTKQGLPVKASTPNAKAHSRRPHRKKTSKR